MCLDLGEDDNGQIFYLNNYLQEEWQRVLLYFILFLLIKKLIKNIVNFERKSADYENKYLIKLIFSYYFHLYTSILIEKIK